MNENNKFHGIDVDIATEYGIEEALVIRFFQQLLDVNNADGRNVIDGRVWVVASTEYLAESFPYMNARKIRYTIENLVKKGVLIKGNYNESAFDKTTWYTFGNQSTLLKTAAKGGDL